MAAQKVNVGPIKPKNPVSAFDYFSRYYLQQVKESLGEALIPIIGLTARCLYSWNTLATDQRQYFQSLAEKDRKRHQLEMENYGLRVAKEKRNAKTVKDLNAPAKRVMNPNEPTKKVKNPNAPTKKVKDPNAPKKPLSAFFWFCKEERPNVKERNPGLTFGEIAIELGRLWRAASSETKNRYHTLAETDNARYQRDMAAYTNSQAVGSTSGRR